MSDASQPTSEDSTRQQSGLPDPEEMSQEELDEIEEERKRRLDPENRPDMAEVDNTDREFDLERGEFVDARDEREETER